MSKPLIGVCSRWDSEKGQYYLHPRDCRMVSQAGGTPVILPFDFRDMELLDGIVFTGGGDVNCALGKYEDCSLVRYDAPERDEAELRHCLRAVELGLPILAICRGYQLVNAVLGGTLTRDIAEAGYTRHFDTVDGKTVHTIQTVPGTLMRQLFGAEMQVLSLHHQAVAIPAPGLTVNAHTADGLIEGYEDPARHILGMQTHPEMMDFQPPYVWLVEQAKAYHNNRKG